jgi:hypothetical protein
MNLFAHALGLGGRQIEEMTLNNLRRLLNRRIKFCLFLCHGSLRITASGYPGNGVEIPGFFGQPKSLIGRPAPPLLK